MDSLSINKQNFALVALQLKFGFRIRLSSVVCSEYDLEVVFWLYFAKLLGACTGLVQFNAAHTCLHCLHFTNKGSACMHMFAGKKK